MDPFGIGSSILVALFVLATLFRAVSETFEWKTGRVGELLKRLTFQPSDLKRLGPLQVLSVSLWYFFTLWFASYLLYALLASPDLPLLSREVSKLLVDTVNGNETARFLVQCFAAGIVGATIYGIMWISRIHGGSQEWYFRRYLLLPVLGGFLGAASYLFVRAGLITIQLSGGGADDDPGSVSTFAIWGIAFLSGFASRELTAKLIQIAEAVFATAPEASPVTPDPKPDEEDAASQQEKEDETSARAHPTAEDLKVREAYIAKQEEEIKTLMSRVAELKGGGGS